MGALESLSWPGRRDEGDGSGEAEVLHDLQGGAVARERSVSDQGGQSRRQRLLGYLTPAEFEDLHSIITQQATLS